MSKHHIFWLPELGWLVSFSEAKRTLPSGDGLSPPITLRLCYRCADFQPFFVEQELFLKAAHAFTFAQSNPTHIGRIQLTAAQRKEYEKFKIPASVIDQLDGFIPMMEEDSQNSDLLGTVPLVHRREATGKKINAAQIAWQRRVAPFAQSESITPCVHCGAPSLPGEQTCYAHHNK